MKRIALIMVCFVWYFVVFDYQLDTGVRGRMDAYIQMPHQITTRDDVDALRKILKENEKADNIVINNWIELKDKKEIK
jgi:hypothetical protein